MRSRNRPGMILDAYGNPVIAESSKETRRYEGHDGAVYHLAASRDGRYLLSGGRDGTVRLWETRGIDSQLHEFDHPGPVEVAVFTNNGSRVATVSMGYLRIWSLDGTGQMRPIPLSGRGPSRRGIDYTIRNDLNLPVANLPQAGVLPSSNQTGALTPLGTLVIWNGDTGTILKTMELTKGKSSFQAAVFTQDGKEVITGDSEGRVAAWDLQSGKELRTKVYPGNSVSSLAIAGNDKEILAAITPVAKTSGKVVEGSVRQLERHTMKETNSFPGHGSPITHLAVAPSGRSFLSGCADGTARWQELYGRGKIKVVAIPGGQIGALAFVKEDQFVSAGGDNSIRLWNLPEGQELQRFDGHRAAISELAYSSSKNLLLSGSVDRSARIWKIGSTPNEARATNAITNAGKTRGGLAK